MHEKRIKTKNKVLIPAFLPSLERFLYFLPRIFHRFGVDHFAKDIKSEGLMVMSPHHSENQQPHFLLWWVLASLVLHLFLLSIWTIIPKDILHKTTPHQSTSLASAPSMTFILNPPSAQPEQKIKEQIVIPTMPSQEVALENPNAILESERNTQLRSLEQGTQSDLPLPQQTGDPRTGFSYLQTPASKASPQQSSPPPSPTQTPPAPKATPLNPNPESLKEPPLLDSSGIPLFQEKSPKRSQQNPTSNPKAQAENKPPQTASPMSFARDKSQISGSKNSEKGENSPESKATDLGRYKSKVYRSIGSRWYHLIDQQMSLLGVGYVKIKFFVQANGVIREIQLAEDSGQTEILEKICIRSVRDSGPFEPFTDSLKQQLGEGFWEEITFTVY